MNVYRDERQKAFDSKTSSKANLRNLKKDLDRLRKENRHVTRAAEQERKQVQGGNAKLKKAVKKQLARMGRAKAKARLREERIRFWPRKFYRLILCLDTNTGMTPGSSRPGSTDRLVKLANQISPKASKGSDPTRPNITRDSYMVSLSISYITQCAAWSPRYDLSISTTSRSGRIVYRAEFYNRTSECWRDNKVIFCTSQTSFQGRSEPIPILMPWQIRFSKSNGQHNVDEALFSRSETDVRRKSGNTASNKIELSCETLFGLDESDTLGLVNGTPNPPVPPSFLSSHVGRHPQAKRNPGTEPGYDSRGSSLVANP